MSIISSINNITPIDDIMLTADNSVITSTGDEAMARSRSRKATPPIHQYLSGNALVCADNLDVLRELPAECIDLIYLDPPFQFQPQLCGRIRGQGHR